MTVLNYLSAVKGHLQDDGFKTQGDVFKLCCKATSVMLILASLFLTASEMFGPPIMCLSDVESRILEQYCWISSTYTLSDYGIREKGEMAKRYLILLFIVLCSFVFS